MRWGLGIQLLALRPIKVAVSSVRSGCTEIVATTRWPVVPPGTIKPQSWAKTVVHHTYKRCSLCAEDRKLLAHLLQIKVTIRLQPPHFTPPVHVFSGGINCWHKSEFRWDPSRLRDWATRWHDQTPLTLLHYFHPSLYSYTILFKAFQTALSREQSMTLPLLPYLLHPPLSHLIQVPTKGPTDTQGQSGHGSQNTLTRSRWLFGCWTHNIHISV